MKFNKMKPVVITTSNLHLRNSQLSEFELIPESINAEQLMEVPTHITEEIHSQNLSQSGNEHNSEPIKGIASFNNWPLSSWLEGAVKKFLPDNQLWWVYLGLITLAELLTALLYVQAGLLLHALLLVGFLIHGALGRDAKGRHLALAMTLAPLIRLLSLSLPLTSFSQIIWYPMVAVPLLIAGWLIVRQINLSRLELGLSLGNVPLQLALSLGGIGLGAIEYIILQPRPLFSSIEWIVIVLSSLSLLIFTGFNEEIIFRGLLQNLAQPVLGKWALIYVSLLFSVLHMGYLSLLDLIFVFGVGLLFAYIVKRGGSLLGVVLAHGLTNSTMFLIMPYLNQTSNETINRLVPWVILISSLISVGAIFVLFKANLVELSKAFKKEVKTGEENKSR